MTVNKEQLHAQYVYNSAIEFIYFIIIYIESYDFIFLSTLIKHVKFFKVEVAELLSSFGGNSSEEKLCSMLKTVSCFIISENQIKGRKTLHLKNFIFEDLILSKTVDLALKGLTDIEDICQNLNFNNVISIDKKNLLSILQKSSHFCIERNCSVNLLHFHGILGFESYSYNLIICYFQNILQHGQILSYNEIEYHAKFTSFCGMYGVLPILCVLYCSNNFLSENGQIILNKISEKSKQKPLDLKLRENISETTVSVGKIVHHVYGSCLQRWTGEICNLTKEFGIIYCVIVFTDNHQGVFKVYFNKWALKWISEICSLKDYFKIRDIVEFDAKYYQSKKFGDYWKATKIKISSSARFDYEESLLNELRENSELQRKHCEKNKCCCDSDYSYRNCFHVSCCNEILSNKYNLKECSLQNLFPKKCMICDNDTKSLKSQSHIIYKEVVNNSTQSNQEVSNGFSECVSNIILPEKCKIGDNDINLLNDTSHVCKTLVNDCTLPNPESSKCFSQSVSSFILPDYLFVFGHVFMLMADKGIAVTKQGNKLFNILFLKDSIYPPNKSQNVLVKGQKVLALIPYIEEMDKVPVASLIYGLSEDEEANLPNPKDFARNFLPDIFKDLNHKLNNSCCNIVNSLLTLQPDCFVIDLPQPTQLCKLYELIIIQCNISVIKVSLLGFWKRMIRAFSKRITKEGAISCIIKLSKDLKKRISLEGKLQAKRRRKMKWSRKTLSIRSELGKDEFLTEVSKVHLSPNTPTRKFKSMNLSKSSSSSLNSYKSCYSINSTDTFYSCESDLNDFSTEDAVKENIAPNNVTGKCNSMDLSKGSLSSLSSYKSSVSTNSTGTFFLCNSGRNSPNRADFSDKLDSDKSVRFVLDEELATPLSTILNSNSSLTLENVDKISEDETNKRSIRDNKSKHVKGAKYISLQSFPFLKHISNRKRNIFRAASASRSACTDCYKRSLKLHAYISLITDSFFFYTVNINDSSVALPLPRRIISEKLQEKMKLNSCSDIVIIPNTPVNLSHILSVTIVC